MTFIAATSRRFRVADDGKRRLVRGTINGVEFWEARWTDWCSGCSEWEDGHPVTLGAGCDECGYRGRRVQSWPVAFDPAQEEQMHGMESA